MSILEIHAEALENNSACYHEFLSRYSKTNRVVYGFVEGKDDPCFYRGFIENQIPHDWSVELWAAGNKDQVYQIHTSIDWRRFSKKRICFFVDRDLSDLLPETINKDINIYVTECYSIENDIVNRGTCFRVLTEVCGLQSIPHNELEQACDIFEQELDKFVHAMIPVTAWILLWRRSRKKACLNDIMMKDIFSFVDCRLNINTKPKRKLNLADYIHGQCNIAYDHAFDSSTAEAEIKVGDIYKKFTRGKYLFWFLIEFCCSVRKSATTIFRSCTEIPPMHVSLSTKNGVTIIGNRARIPSSLREFLARTYCDFITLSAA